MTGPDATPTADGTFVVEPQSPPQLPPWTPGDTGTNSTCSNHTEEKNGEAKRQLGV